MIDGFIEESNNEYEYYGQMPYEDMTKEDIIDTLKGLLFGLSRTTAKERKALDMAIWWILPKL